MNWNIVETTKNIFYVKCESAIDHSTVTRWFLKFCSGCKNLDTQAFPDQPTTMDSEVGFQAKEINPVSST